MRARGRRLNGGIQRRRRRRERGPACFSCVDAAGWLWPPRMTRANARGGGVFAWPHRQRATAQRPCRGSLARAPLPRLASGRPRSRNAMRHATAASRANRCVNNAESPASNLHHLHQTCITYIKPASPAPSLHHLHQTARHHLYHVCITCTKPAPPSPRVHHASRRGIPVVSPLAIIGGHAAARCRGEGGTSPRVSLGEVWEALLDQTEFTTTGQQTPCL